MSLSIVQHIIEQTKKLTITQKLELMRSLLDDIIIADDHFSEEEIAEIQEAIQEVDRGEWVDFDEFRKIHNI